MPVQKIILHNCIYTFVFLSVMQLFCGLRTSKIVGIVSLVLSYLCIILFPSFSSHDIPMPIVFHLQNHAEMHTRLDKRNNYNAIAIFVPIFVMVGRLTYPRMYCK